MGQDATATLSEIEAARQRLAKDIDELDRRARPEHDLPEQAQRIAVAAAGAGVGLAVLLGLARRRWRSHRHHRHARLHAEAVADLLEQRGLTGSLLHSRADDPARDVRAGAAMLATAVGLGAVLGRAFGGGR